MQKLFLEEEFNGYTIGLDIHSLIHLESLGPIREDHWIMTDPWLIDQPRMILIALQ